MIPASPQAYTLLHEGSLALARVEEAGMRIDMDYLKKAWDDAKAKAASIESELMKTDVFRTWRKQYGAKTNLGSLTQLSHVFFKVMDLQVPGQARTPTGRLKADETTLQKLDHPFIKKYFQAKKYRNITSTFLGGIRKYVDDDGFLRPSINLHIVKTYRSSEDKPNGQNFPARNEEFAEIVRRCFIARGENYLIGEIDFKAIEVGIAACYNHDPALMHYVENSPPLDMHRDMAMACYRITDEKMVSKGVRYCAKNMFVFPEFYGSYFRDCSRNLWEATEKMKLEVAGTPMRTWLAGRGIKSPGNFDGDPSPGTFEYHIKKVEEKFWKKFHVYKAWKERWIKDYEKKGGYPLLTGFTVNGVYRRNEIINGAVQGTAFHCNLWTLIELQKWLRKYKMKSKIIGEIHDSQIIDFHREEVEDVLAMVQYLVTKKLPKEWPWICVPLSVEAEIAPEGKSWYEKETVYPITAPAGKSRLSWDGKEERWAWR